MDMISTKLKRHRIDRKLAPLSLPDIAIELNMDSRVDATCAWNFTTPFISRADVISVSRLIAAQFSQYNHNISNQIEFLKPNASQIRPRSSSGLKETSRYIVQGSKLWETDFQKFIQEQVTMGRPG